jgi:hypothetical protein
MQLKYNDAHSAASSFPRKWESRLSTRSLVESLDSRVRGNDGFRELTFYR